MKLVLRNIHAHSQSICSKRLFSNVPAWNIVSLKDILSKQPLKEKLIEEMINPATPLLKFKQCLWTIIDMDDYSNASNLILSRNISSIDDDIVVAALQTYSKQGNIDRVITVLLHFTLNGFNILYFFVI